MTIRDKLTALLVDNGMFPDEARLILDRYLESDLGKSMQGRMDDSVTDYPPALHATVWLGVKATALKWISEHCPQHWARSFFTV